MKTKWDRRKTVQKRGLGLARTSSAWVTQGPLSEGRVSPSSERGVWQARASGHAVREHGGIPFTRSIVGADLFCNMNAGKNSHGRGLLVSGIVIPMPPGRAPAQPG